MRVAFWALYEQLGSSLNVFADRLVDRRVFGHEIPAAMLQGLPSIFVILGATLFSSLWMYLARRHRDPSAAMKFSFAIALVGLAFLTLSAGIDLTEPGDKSFIAGQIARLTAQSVSNQSAASNTVAMENYAHVYIILGCGALGPMELIARSISL
ncbi:hypothetical protein [Steroidobacter flavus]